MKVYTTSQAAEVLQCSGEAIRQAIKSGKLSAFTIGNGSKRKSYRITQDALDDYAAANTVDPPAPPTRRVSRSQRPKRRWV